MIFQQNFCLLSYLFDQSASYIAHPHNADRLAGERESVLLCHRKQGGYDVFGDRVGIAAWRRCKADTRIGKILPVHTTYAATEPLLAASTP